MMATGLFGASGLFALNSIKAAKSANPKSYVPEATLVTAPPEPLPASTVTSRLASLKYPFATGTKNKAEGPSKRQSS